MYKNNRISIVMSCLNEADKIGNSVTKIKKICKGLVDEIIVVDDGSKDHTSSEAKKAGATVIRHLSNLGAGAGYRTAYLYTLKNKYDITVEMAGDDQDNPKDVLSLVKKIVDEGYEYVHGSRWISGSKRVNHPLSRSLLTRIYSYIFALASGFPATDATNGIRAFRTSILANPNINLSQKWLDHYELEPYFFYKVIHEKYRVTEVPVTKIYHHKMKHNTKMVPIKSWWSIFRPIVILKLGLKA